MKKIVGWVFALVSLVSLLPLVADTLPARHEVRLVAREMAFFVDGRATPNPTIVVPAGSKVRVVLRNDDPGMTHDFAVKTLDVAIRPLKTAAEGEVEFRTPNRPGRYEYVCNPHARMMYGMLIVQ